MRFVDSKITIFKQQSGFSLLEVLIALLVVSLGFLGIAGLNSSYRLTQDALNRQTAAVIALDLSNRIKMNRQNYNAYNNPGAVSEVNCIESDCSKDQLAQFDIYYIREHAKTELPGGKVHLCVSNAGASNELCKKADTAPVCGGDTATPNLQDPSPSKPDPQYCPGSVGYSVPVFVISVFWTGLQGKAEKYVTSIVP